MERRKEGAGERGGFPSKKPRGATRLDPFYITHVPFYKERAKNRRRKRRRR